MSGNADRRIAIAVLGVTIVGVVGTWLAVPAVYKRLVPEPSVDGRRDVSARQDPPVSEPPQTQSRVNQEKKIQSRVTAENAPRPVPNQHKAYPQNFQFMIGEWECVDPANTYRMRVGWDSQSGQFLGYLTKLGQASQFYGFRIGERVWVAKPINDQSFVEQQKWRGGLGTWWKSQNVDIRESSRDHLSGYNEYKRVQ